MPALGTDRLAIDRAGVNHRITVAEINALAPGAVVGGWTTVKKLGDEIRVSTTTLTADFHLQTPLGIGTWEVVGIAYFNTANANMDYKYACAFVGGTATYTNRVHSHTIAGAPGGAALESMTVGTGVIPSTPVIGTTFGRARVAFELTIVVTVAGTFQFRWAQNTLDAGQLTCARGSYLNFSPF